MKAQAPKEPPLSELGRVESIKAAAVMNFIDTLIGALDAGFVENNKPTLATLHQVARHHVKDFYGLQYGDIVERWGEDTAKDCGLGEVS